MEYYERFNQTIKQVFGDNIQADLQESPESNFPFSEAPPQVVSRATTLDESFVRLGDTYVHLKKYNDALDCYREALKINQGNIMAFNRLLIIPPHLLELDRKFPADTYSLEEMDSLMSQLTLNDVFRQTLVGGYIVLSKSMMDLDAQSTNAIFWAIQNLDHNYFKKHGGPTRDYGVIVLNGTSYVWMINHCNYQTMDSEEHFPVLIVMKRREYQSLKKILQV